MAQYQTPKVDEAWSFIRREIIAGRPMPTSRAIAIALGRAGKTPAADDLLSALLSRGLVCCHYTRGAGPRKTWALTRLGRFEIDHPDVAPSGTPSGETGEPAAAAGSPVQRKPRRTGSPKRVPHEPTTAHRKPSRREGARRREHQDRTDAPLQASANA